MLSVVSVVFPALCVMLGPTARPTLSGTTATVLSPDGLFKVHYTLTGADALRAPADTDPANGVPDFVDWVIEGAARVRQAFVVTDGWPDFPPDEGLGGDNRLDIYIRASNANGYAHEEPLPSGARASWIEVNPSVAEWGKETVASVAGHELHHVLQFTVMQSSLPGWVYEATATYAQYLLFDDPNLTVARLGLWLIRLAGAANALDKEGDRFEYAGMTWVKFLIDRAGGQRTKLLALWQAMNGRSDWVLGHDDFVKTIGLAGLDAAASEYAVWNFFACNSDDGLHWSPTLPCNVNAGVPTQVLNMFPSSGTSVSIGPRGSAYLELVPDRNSADLEVTIRPTGRMRLSVISLSATGESPVTVQDAPAGVDTVVRVNDWNQWRRVVVVATNAQDSFDKTLTWTAATVARAGGCRAVPGHTDGSAQFLLVTLSLALMASRGWRGRSRLPG